MMVGTSNYESVPTEESGGGSRTTFPDANSRPPFVRTSPIAAYNESRKKRMIMAIVLITFILATTFIIGVGIAVAHKQWGDSQLFNGSSAASFSQDNGKREGMDKWDSWEDTSEGSIQNMHQQFNDSNQYDQVSSSSVAPPPVYGLSPYPSSRPPILIYTTPTPYPISSSTEPPTTPLATTTTTTTTTTTPTPTTTPALTTPAPTTTLAPLPNSTSTPPPAVPVYPTDYPGVMPTRIPAGQGSYPPIRQPIGTGSFSINSSHAGNGTIIDSDDFNSDMSVIDYMVLMQQKVPVGVLLSILVFAIVGSVSLLGIIIWVLRRRNNKLKRRAQVRRAIDELQDHDKSNLLHSDDEV